MKTRYISSAFFLILGISIAILAKSSHHHTIAIKNDSPFNIILAEFEQGVEKQTHSVNPKSESKCNFFKNTDHVEARVKTASATYCVGIGITSNSKKITLTHNKHLHMRAE